MLTGTGTSPRGTENEINDHYYHWHSAAVCVQSPWGSIPECVRAIYLPLQTEIFMVKFEGAGTLSRKCGAQSRKDFFIFIIFLRISSRFSRRRRCADEYNAAVAILAVCSAHTVKR